MYHISNKWNWTIEHIFRRVATKLHSAYDLVKGGRMLAYLR